MVEAIVSATLAAIAGVAAVTNKVHSRINHVYDRLIDMDRRVDGIELHIAESYVTKTDLASTIQSIEDHMVRIEQKLDQIALNK